MHLLAGDCGRPDSIVASAYPTPQSIGVRRLKFRGCSSVLLAAGWRDGPERQLAWNVIGNCTHTAVGVSRFNAGVKRYALAVLRAASSRAAWPLDVSMRKS